MTFTEICFCVSLVILCGVILLIESQIRDLKKQIDQVDRTTWYVYEMAAGRRKGQHNDRQQG